MKKPGSLAGLGCLLCLPLVGRGLVLHDRAQRSVETFLALVAAELTGGLDETLWLSSLTVWLFEHAAMFLCFVDESTTPPKPTKKDPRPYFVVAGIFVPVVQWHAITEEVLRLKQSYRVRGEIKWRFFGTDNNDAENTVKHLSRDERDRFRRRFFGILKARKSIVAVICVASVKHAYALSHVKDEHDLYGQTYKPVSERFQYHLQDVSRSVGEKKLGIIIADHRGRKDDERMRREHQKLLHANARTISDYTHLVESVFLTPSNTSTGIQCADMIAGAVSRRFNSGDEYWFNEVKGLIRTKPDGTIDGYGLVKFPNNW